MRHDSARIAKLESDLADMDREAVYRKAECDQLKAKLAHRGDDYRLRDLDIRDLALAAHEIRGGDPFGIRRLEEFMDSLEPRWRGWS